MRGSVVVALVLAGSAAYACDSFEESGGPPADAGSPDTSTANVDASASEASAPCEGEPEWAYPGGPVPTVATCRSVPGVDLLTSAEHCGRCGHSCGIGGSCKDGVCVAKQEDAVLSVPMRVADGVLYYAHRPAFGTDEVVRLLPGESPVILGRNDLDAGIDREIVSMAPAADALYVRTKQSLRRTSKTEASTAVPEPVALLSAEPSVSFVTVAPDGKLIVAAATEKRYVAVTTTGTVTPFIEDIAHPLEAAFAGDRFVWMSQPFQYNQSGNSVLRIREGGTDRVLLDSAQNAGGLVIDGEQAFVIRSSATGGSILAIDLKDGTQHPLYDGAIANASYQHALAVDATHVYWVKSLDGGGFNSELWKRARCGGAAVRIASHSFIFAPKLVGDRIYFGATDGLWSIAK